MRWICHGATSVGRERKHNEDRLWIGAEPACACAVVDGMGGQSTGHIAAAAAVTALSRYAFDDEDRALDEVARDAMQRAHAAVVASGTPNVRLAWGATAALLVGRGAELVVSHVGDCRAYLVRDQAIEQLTVDHSLVEDFARNRSATRAELDAFRAQFGNIIMRALGFSDPIEVDTTLIEARRGDRLLLCSDGLWSSVEPESMLSIVTQSPTLERACEALLASADAGEDDHTVVLARIVDTDARRR